MPSAKGPKIMSRTRAAKWLMGALGMLFTLLYFAPALAQGVMHETAPRHHGGGEANLVVPNLADPSLATFMSGRTGASLLYVGLVVSALGMAFGFMIYSQLKNLPVHKSMLEISELIYETCKTYLVTQLRFIVILELFIGATIVYY